MGYHPRIESADLASFQTTRSRNSELWFVNNQNLEEAILGYAARYATRHEVIMYALSIEGNHTQQVNQFPRANRSEYMRDFNSAVARAVPRYQKEYRGGRFWARRYSSEFLPGCEDIEEYFFYTVLQPVNDGLVDEISQYPGYNCFEDAVTGRERQYKVVKWKEYNDAKRWDSTVSIDEFTEICTLRYARLPGYEHMSQADYATVMRKKLKDRTALALQKRGRKLSLGAQRLRLVRPGSLPHKTKTSHRHSHRPRVLSRSPERRSACEAWYFQTYFEYKVCSKRYRLGEQSVEFPKGTYKPSIFHPAPSLAVN
jgi:hypothetical protein